jgi:hypothetical protein
VKRYIIISPYISDEERAELVKVNRKGGLSLHGREARLWLWLALVLFLAWLFVPSRMAALNIVLLISALGCWLYYTRNYVKLVEKLKHPKALVTTIDPEIISLDKDWLKVVAAQPAEWQAAEDQKRFMSVRRLADTPAGAERTEEILLLRRSLQEQDRQD